MSNLSIELQDLVASLITAPHDFVKIQKVNNFFNNKLECGSDAVIYHVNDYWATLKETITKRVGDCDDYALAKYQILQALSIESYVAIVEYRHGSDVKHMVCMAKHLTDWYVLDNLNPFVVAEFNRTDIRIIAKFGSNNDTVTSRWYGRWLNWLKRSNLKRR